MVDQLVSDFVNVQIDRQILALLVEETPLYVDYGVQFHETHL